MDNASVENTAAPFRVKQDPNPKVLLQRSRWVLPALGRLSAWAGQTHCAWLGSRGVKSGLGAEC